MPARRAASPAASENTRLLGSDTSFNSSREDLEDVTAKHQRTPLPKKQLGVLFSIRFSEPVLYSHLYPYINQFVRDIGVAGNDSRNVGFYSGMIESVFAFGEVCSIFVLSRLSDRIGRRPVLLPSAAGIGIFTALFGLSTSFTMMLILRIFAGLLAGGTPIVHSIVSELTDETNNAIAIPIYGLITPIGFAIGPLIGGTLEHAATKYPHIFGYEFLRKYPYFLPSFVPSCLAVLGVILGYFFLEETLPSKVKQEKAERRKSSCSTSSDSSTLYGATDSCRGLSEPGSVEAEEEEESDARPKGIKALVKDPSIRAIMGSGTFLMFLYTSFDVLFSLYCFTAVEDGGVGLPPNKIGYAFSVAGCIAMLMQLCITPWVLRTFDKAKVYNFCMCTFPVVFCLMGCLNPIARAGYDEASQSFRPATTSLLYATIAVLLLLARVCVMAFPISMILIKQNASKHSLASANGLVQVSMTIARAVCPTLSSSIFAYSTSHNILGGHFWVVIMMAISMAGIWQSTNIARTARRKAER
ncbi:putative Psilocybin Transporter (PsiT) [Gymnopilus dilepis]|uniref:Putative Psilocybin Transporter (PsiT) n=1 Tax=Gymnopilus dilepis TaxID=231916 RepID=A0A409VX72_9AGAR|nr:putative Psilocybin Transporter (PsiT) [Gymnopilus dilepis]